MAFEAVSAESENLNRASTLRFIQSGASESLGPQEILTWGIKNFAPSLALSASFGAPEGMVLLDMMHRIDPESRVFSLDTGRIPQETYDLMDRVRDRYDVKIEVVSRARRTSRRWCASRA